MADSSAILIDTSVWIRFFRSAGSPEAMVIDTVLSMGVAATCAPIRVEVLSGAPNRREFDRLRDLFAGLVDLELPQDAWTRMEEHRFALARRGHHASLVDLLIALTAQARHTALWTLDEDFQHIAAVIPVARYHPNLSGTREREAPS